MRIQSNSLPSEAILPILGPEIIMFKLRLAAVFLAMLEMTFGHSALQGADKLSVRQLMVSPSEITLTSARDSQAIVAVIVHPDGSTTDVSAIASVTAARDGLIRVHEGIVEPVADGETELIISTEDLKQRIKVAVSGADKSPTLTFRNDVLPVLTRAGCNTGRCHGQAAGKDGFKLSLFGYDPAGDYERLTREFAGRRINLATPEDCLMMNKALGKVPHTGGQRIEEESREYRVLIDWLTTGAKPDPKAMPLPVGIEVFPKKAIFTNAGDASQTLMVLAHYSDGSDRDVTDDAVFLSNNEGAASVTKQGLVSSVGPGTAFILARFDQFTAGTNIIVRPDKPFVFPEIPANNYIDEFVYEHWKNLHLTPSGLSSDEEFLRRVSIDLLGLLPTPEELQRFVADKSKDKREVVVDALLNRPEFLDLWVMKWAETLQIRTVSGMSPKGLDLYDKWLRERIRGGATVADVLHDVIPASGGTFENPASNYFQTETSPQLLAENVSQAFLGMRIQCAACHNHPFDQWTMDDYYGFAAFFSQVGYKTTVDPRELAVYNAGEGEMRHPLGDRVVAPKFLGGESPKFAEEEDYRKSLSAWLASKDNPGFSRNIANIVWAHMFGVGIVEPFDDVRISNPPSNPTLLDELGKRIAASNFDIKELVRDICKSRVYQLTSDRTKENEWDQRHFSHSKIRRMRAEVLLDCINQVTGATNEWPGLPPGSRAVQLADGRTRDYFLTAFGRSTRETACSCEVSTSPTLSQALHLLNGEVTSGKINEGGVIDALLAKNKEPMSVVENLYLRCFGRQPTSKERTGLAKKLSASSDPKETLTDLFWAMLNSSEFIFNH